MGKKKKKTKEQKYKITRFFIQFVTPICIHKYSVGIHQSLTYSSFNAVYALIFLKFLFLAYDRTVTVKRDLLEMA